MFVTYQAEIQSANILRASAHTNGPQGGDSGHGCQTIIGITDEGGTDMECDWNAEKKSLTITLGGDSELETIIEAFEFIAKSLRAQSINRPKNATKNVFALKDLEACAAKA